MSRRRMIAPEIWGSKSFSKLSIFAKLVFIGLISNADDEGRGIADPEELRYRLFPRNPTIRVTDIQNALSQIAREMSITIYVDKSGNSYYTLTKWALWQTIGNPKPSIYPDPQTEQSVGERGSYTQSADFGQDAIHHSIYNINNNTKREEKIKRSESARARGNAPSLEEIQAYCKKRKNNIDPQRFFDYYEANGWTISGQPIRSWQAMVRRWETNGIDEKTSTIGSQITADELEKLFIQITEDD